MSQNNNLLGQIQNSFTDEKEEWLEALHDVCALSRHEVGQDGLMKEVVSKPSRPDGWDNL